MTDQDPESVVMCHIQPIASFDDNYIDLNVLMERVQANRNDRDNLVEADYVQLELLRNIIEKSLSCATSHTDSGIPVPCYTDRMEASKAMLLYLAVQNIVHLDQI
jgi:hypothetical protein